MGDFEIKDFAKVQLLNENTILWFINPFAELKINDLVLVPFNNKLLTAKVLKIEKNLTTHTSPIPIKRAKEIHSILNNKEI